MYSIYIYVYIALSKLGTVSVYQLKKCVPGPQTDPVLRILRAFGFGFRPPLPAPAWVWATFRPRTAQDRQHGSQERPRTANIGPKSGPRPPTYVPRGPKTANIGPKSGPGPPT